MRIYVKKSNNKSGAKEMLWIDFSHNGKRYRKSLKLENTPANIKLAKQKILPRIQLQVYNGEFFKTTIPTVAEFMPKSLAIHKSSRRKVTQDGYVGAYNLHIKPKFGSMKLDAIKPSHIAEWQNELLLKISPARIKAIRAVLSTMFTDALKDEIINKNPLKLVSVPKIAKTKITPFSMDEISSILNKESEFTNFYALAFFTGMRSGEMIGLKWSDINFDQSEITISRAIKMGIISKTKTGQERTIDIIDMLVPYLKNQYKITGDKNSYVFLNKQETHIYDIKRIRNTHWKRTLKACSVEYRPIYHTRHTFATVMLENGEDILWVSNMLGHADPSMTLSKYARYIKRDKKKRAQFLNDSLTLNGTNLAPGFKKVS